MKRNAFALLLVISGALLGCDEQQYVSPDTVALIVTDDSTSMQRVNRCLYIPVLLGGQVVFRYEVDAELKALRRHHARRGDGLVRAGGGCRAILGGHGRAHGNAAARGRCSARRLHRRAERGLHAGRRRLSLKRRLRRASGRVELAGARNISGALAVDSDMRRWRSFFIRGPRGRLAFSAGGCCAAHGTLPLTRVRFYETGVGYFERSGAVPGGETSSAGAGGAARRCVEDAGGAGRRREGQRRRFREQREPRHGAQVGGFARSGRHAAQLFASCRAASRARASRSRPRRARSAGRLVEVLEPGQGELERCAAAPAKRGESTLHQAGLSAARARQLAALDQRGRAAPSRQRRRSQLAAERAGSSRPARRGAGRAFTAWRSDAARLGRARRRPAARSRSGTSRRRRFGARRIASCSAPTRPSCKVGRCCTTIPTKTGTPSRSTWSTGGRRRFCIRWRRRATPDASWSRPRRPAVSVPQLFDTTVDNLWSGGLGLDGTARAGRIGRMASAALARSATAAGMASWPVSPREQRARHRQPGVAHAGRRRRGRGAVSLHAAQSLALQAHGSALVPFLDSAIKVRQIAWFSAQSEAAASALHVTNDTKQTLPARNAAGVRRRRLCGRVAACRAPNPTSRTCSATASTSTSS